MKNDDEKACEILERLDGAGINYGIDPDGTLWYFSEDEKVRGDAIIREVLGMEGSGAGVMIDTGGMVDKIIEAMERYGLDLAAMQDVCLALQERLEIMEGEQGNE